MTSDHDRREFGVNIALAQTPVSANVEDNARHIRALMRRARGEGADLIQFTEGALSGYGKKVLTPFERWDASDWDRLRREAETVAALAGGLGLWVVVGSVHPLGPGQRPHNCLYVIGPDGALVTRYDKRFCSNTEINGWYTPGFEPCVFTVKGVRFGCAICLDGGFPEIFEEYRRLGVHCVLFSTFTAGRRDERDAKQDTIWGIKAQANAANHTYWISMVTPCNPVQGARTQFIDPLGGVIGACRRHRRELVLGRIDLGPGSLWQSIEWGREWRNAARQGDIYRAHSTDSARSRDRQSF